jgi:hypothetical protein
MDLNKSIPQYLLEKGNVVKMILFTAVFALVFINVYSPFDSRQWIKDISEFRYFVLSCILVLSGVAIVAVSRVIMYKIYSDGKRELSLFSYLVWTACELCAMSAGFVVMEVFFFHDSRDIMELMRISLKNTALVLLLPYSVSWLYFSWCDKTKRLQGMTSDGASSSEQEAELNKQRQMVVFTDSKGDVKLSIKLCDLLYLKGTDNYVTIFYKIGSSIGNTLVRNTMKQMEHDLKEKGIVRCHRSYMVNRQHIKMFAKERDGFVVKLETDPPMQISVSKSYVNDVFELFER